MADEDAVETTVEDEDEPQAPRAHPEPVPTHGLGAVQDNVSEPGVQRTHLPDGSVSEHGEPSTLLGSGEPRDDIGTPVEKIEASAATAPDLQTTDARPDGTGQAVVEGATPEGAEAPTEGAPAEGSAAPGPEATGEGAPQTEAPPAQ